jgi:hypothetical protein
MADALKNATQQAQQGTAEGTKKWDAMSEEQKKATFVLCCTIRMKQHPD